MMITKTEVTDWMTAEDVHAELKKLCVTVGSGASASMFLYTVVDRYRCKISIHPGNHQPDADFTGTSWPEAFAAAYAWVGTHKQVRRNNIIRKMALSIIEITDEHGSCAEARLKAAAFTREEITEFHQPACARASEMCASAPFSVLMEVA